MFEFKFILLTTANILYIFCYGVRDVLWLRLLAVAAMVLLLPYYAVHELWDCICWQIVFIAINVYWIVAIVRERQPPKMTKAESQLYDSVFKGSCSAKDMLRLIKKADWNEVDYGDVIIKQGTDLDKLIMIHKGRVSVQIEGEEVATLGPGNLVGEMSFLTQEKTVADVLALGKVRFLSWKRGVLEQMFDDNVPLKSAINEIIGRDLVHKLSSQGKAARIEESHSHSVF